MNKQEFIDRTGLTPTDEEYVTIEDIYMAAKDMDKDAFCREYKKHGHSMLIESLYVEIGVQKAQARTARQTIENLNKENSDMMDFLIEQAEKWSATDLRDKAIEILGVKEYLLRKLEKGFNLWKSDRQLLIEILG